MAVGWLGAAFANLGINTREWITGLDEGQKKFVSFAASVQVMGFRASAAWGATIGALGFMTLKAGSEFEKAFAGVKKTVDPLTTDFKKLHDQLIDVSKSTTFSAASLADLARIGGQLGVAGNDLAKFTETIAKLNIAAADLSAEEAAVGLARLISISGASMKDVDIFASVLAKLGDEFATTESRILNFSQRIAGLSAVVGITTTDTIALGAAFTATVPGVELVATQLSKGMAIFSQAVAEGGDKLKVLDLLVGHTGKSFKDAFEKDAGGAIAVFLEGLGRLGTAEAFAALRQLGLTNQRAAQAFLAAAKNADKFGDALASARKEAGLARTEQGKLTRTYQEQMKAIAHQWEAFLNKVAAVKIALYEAFGGTLERAIGILSSLASTGEAVAKWIQVWPEPLKDFIVLIAGGVGALAAMTTVLGMVASLVVPLKNAWAGMGTFVKTLFAAQAASGSVSGALGKVTTSIGKLATSTVTWTAALSAAKVALVGVGAYLATDFIIKITGAREGLNKFFEAVYQYATLQKFNLAVESSGRAFQLATLHMKMARDGLVEHIPLAELLAKSEQELNAMLHEGVKAQQAKTQGVKDAAKSMDMQLQFVQQAKEDEELLATATRLLGREVTDLTEAEQILARARELGILPTTESAISKTERYAQALRGLAGLGIPDQILQGLSTTEIRAKAAAKELEELTAKLQEGALERQGLDIPTDAPGTLGFFTEAFQGPQISSAMADAREELAGMLEKATDSDKALDRLANAFRVLGFTGSSGVGRVVGSLQAMQSAISAIGEFSKIGDVAAQAFGGEGGLFRGMGQAFKAGSEEAGGGILGTITGALSVAGPWLQAGMAAFQIFSSIFAKKERWEVIAEETAKTFGQAFSEDLAKAVVESEKQFGSFAKALAANIGDIAEEVGVTAENLGEVWGHFFLGLDTGVASAEQLDKAFGHLKEHLLTMGREGSLMIGEMAKRMREAGVESKQLAEHMKEQGEALTSALTPALKYIGEFGDMTSDQAMAFSGVVVAAFAGAIASTGSFIEAVRMLGDEFKAALDKIMESLGPEGEKLIAPLTSIYNTISQNQEAFDALYGIVSGLDAMAQMGILTGESLAAMAEAARATFEDISARVGDSTAALQSSWPELVKLYDWYKQLGMEVPGWLQDLINKGQEMGLSMEVPLSTADALNRIVEVLEAIADALGAVTKRAAEAGGALEGLGGRGTGPSPRGADYNRTGMEGGRHAQHGMDETVTKPTWILAGEAGPEHVKVTPEGEGGGRPIHFAPVFNISGAGDPNAVVRAIERDLDGAATRVARKLEQMGKI